MVQAVYFGLHCSAIEVTTLWFKQPFCFYSEECMLSPLDMDTLSLSSGAVSDILFPVWRLSWGRRPLRSSVVLCLVFCFQCSLTCQKTLYHSSLAPSSLSVVTELPWNSSSISIYTRHFLLASPVQSTRPAAPKIVRLSMSVCLWLCVSHLSRT